MTDVLILIAALGFLIAGFAFALWWVDRETPHALLDRVAAHLADGRPLIGDHTVNMRRRAYDWQHDEPPTAA